MAFATGIELPKLKDYVDKLCQVKLVNMKNNSLVIKGVEDLDDYLRYIALKEKFEKA